MTIMEDSDDALKKPTVRPEPELSLEWTDLKIEIKYCGNDIPDEVQEFVELFPNMSERVVSSSYILEKKAEYKRRMAKEQGERAAGHTLTQVLEQNKMFQQKRRSEETASPDCEEEEDSKSQNSEDLELPDNIDQLIDVKMLITMEDGSKKCHICGKILNDGTRMKRHLLSHSDKKPYKCNLCGWGFHQKTNMERHLASHTNEGEGHPCSYCNSWFTTKSVVSLHIRQAHADMVSTKTRYEEDDDYSPHASGQESAKKMRPDNLQTHTLPQTDFSEDCDIASLTCNICGKTFVKKTNLKHHIMLHRGEKPWKCHICGWRFVQKCNLKKHIETHNTGTYACPLCDVKFASKGSVSEHITSVHNKQEQSQNMFSKPEQSIILNTDVVVKPEEEEEEAEIPAPVVEARKPGSAASSWWKHIEDSKSPLAEKKPGQIQAGSITITPKTTLNIPSVTPQRLEQALRTFQCNTCPKVFSSRNELSNHTLVHNAGMKKYACPVCGLRFHLLHNMKRHLVTHEESGDIEVGTAEGLLQAVEATAAKVTPDPTHGVTVNAAGHMKCKFCNKWFSEQAALSKHMEVHSVNRPYACPVCGWRFKQMHNMKRHLLTHSGAKPYSCDFCDKSYTDNYSLKQHVAKIHPDIASHLPHMMITPRNKGKLDTPPKAAIQDEQGFQSMVNEMTSSQKQAALQAYQSSLQSQADDQLPYGVEAVTYDDEEDDDDAEMVDPSEFMEEGNLEIEEEMEEEGEQVSMEITPELPTAQIEIDTSPEPEPEKNDMEEIAVEENPATGEDHVDKQQDEESIENEESVSPVPAVAAEDSPGNTENIEDQAGEEEAADHIEIEQPPVTQEVIDEGGEADDEKDKNSD